jgi:ABC-type uncharacterized transport system ATPase subunit
VELYRRADGSVTGHALQLRGIYKRFGDVRALDDATFSLRAGTVHALLGENGAGKTTLMRVAFALVAPDAGTIEVNGAPARLKTPADAMDAGIGMVQQHFTLVPALTALENVALGWSSGRAIRGHVARLAADTGLLVDPDAIVDQLSVADQQRLELLKALARGARTLILDEPTAALAPRETGELLAWIRGFAGRGGNAVLITHKLGDALAIADDVTVLRHGKVTLTGLRSTVTIESLVDAMLGRSESRNDRSAVAPQTPVDTNVAVAERMGVRDMFGRMRVRDASIRIRGGEVVGVAGVEGSGIHEFMYAMAGRMPVTGVLELPDDVGFIPEDRHRDALLMTATIADNFALRSAGTRRGWLDRRTIDARASELAAENDINVADVRAPVSSLSGGNQQRLVLARELDRDPSLVVAMNPTRGLDLNATALVQRRLRQAAERGAGILYSSADLDELLHVADRIFVVFDGRVRDVARDRDLIGRAMVGAA